jgi:peptidyl-prolyl cis-trans isomerase B (cyclophilin B)
MKNCRFISGIFMSFLILIFCHSGIAQKSDKKNKSEPIVLIVTDMGDIKVKLYNETPLHRDNFLKLVQDHFYDSLLFHRVIPAFMIQGGDPTSKKTNDANAMLGNGDVGYTIPAEILPQFYHKKGALAAARQGDDINPAKASSGCQFYIVQGKVFNASEIDQMENSMNFRRKQDLFNKILAMPENIAVRDSLIKYQNEKNQTKFSELVKNKIEPKINEEYNKLLPFKFSDEQKKQYTTGGGAPHLDGGYTVFGEVTEGLEVVDKIAAVQRNQVDRPLTDVKIITAKVISK